MNDFIKKNGLIYSDDLKTLVGIDFENNTFMGRVPFGVHYIEDEVFAGCNYQSVSLPDSVERIGNSLFENSKNFWIKPHSNFLFHNQQCIFFCITFSKYLLCLEFCFMYL